MDKQVMITTDYKNGQTGIVYFESTDRENGKPYSVIKLNDGKMEVFFEGEFELIDHKNDLIPVKATSLAGRVVEGSYTPRQLLDFLDEDELVTNLTTCSCQPVGETNYTECNCDEEWHDFTLLIGDEINK
jgi:hypothetical protein